MLKDTYLWFQCGLHYYAIEENKIDKILMATPFFELPVKDELIKGVLLVEEKIVAIIDIEETKDPRYYIILNINEQYLGVCADEVFGYKVIQDFKWLSQDDSKFPFYYEDKDLKIMHLHFEKEG